jgi:hypothetical protein
MLLSIFPPTVIANVAAAPGEPPYIVSGDFEYSVGDDEKAAIISYFGSADYVEVPDLIDGYAVSALSDQVFAGNENVRAILIPETAQIVGSSAFADCPSLESVFFLSESIVFAPTLFAGSDSLTGLYFLNTLATSVELCAVVVSDFGEEAAQKVSAVEMETTEALLLAYNEISNVNISDTSYEQVDGEDTSEGFLNDESAVSGDVTTYSSDDFTITDGVLTAYSGAGGEVIIPSDVVEIAAGVFQDNAAITSVVLNEGLEIIGDNAFCNCSELSGSLEIPSTVRTIGFYTFAGYNKLTGDLIIPDSVTSIGAYAFRSCYGFDGELRLSENLTEISQGTFLDCNAITGEIVIPDSVTTIGDFAFADMRSITKVVIGTNVTLCGYAPFEMGESIEEFTFKGTTVPQMIDGNEYLCIFGWLRNLKVVYVPRESFSAYVSALATELPERARISIADASEEDGDFIIQDGILLTYVGEGGAVVLPEGVVEIGVGAFRNNTTVTSISFNNGLTKIGDYAFKNCSELTGTLELPESLSAIGNEAFYNCTGLTGNLTLPESLVTIGNHAFYYCIGLSGTLSINSGIENFGEYAFYYCTGLTALALSDGLTVIGDAAFYNCTGLTGALTLNNGIATIGNYAFYNCSKLSGDLVFPDSVISIGYYAFYNCAGFSGSLTIPDNITTIENGVFYNCTGLTGNLEIPASVKTIGQYAFAGCTGLNGTLTLNDGIETIGYGAFNNCSKLKGSLIIPDSVTSLGGYAFYNCAGFNGIIQLSENLTTIPYYAFYDCSNITGELVIPDKVTTIAYYAFRNMSKITSVVFGENVTQIGTSSSSSPFDGDTGIERIIFKSPTVPQLYNSSHSLNIFSPMTKLKTVYVPEGTYAAYTSAYSSKLPSGARIVDTGLDTVFFVRDGVLLAYLGEGGEIVIPEGVVEIGAGVFQNNTAITKVVFNDGLQKIGNSAFQNCTGLNGTLTLSNGLTAIGYSAFAYCNKLTGDLIIPDSVTSLGYSAFQSCSGFNGRIQLSANLTTISDSTFYGCTNITGELIIPDKVTTIAYMAFRNMSKLTSVVIGEKVTLIGNSGVGSYNPFSGCTGLQEMTFNVTAVPHLGSSTSYSNIFSDLTGLKTVYVPRESYSAYVTAYSSLMPTGARITIAGGDADFIIQDGVLLTYLGEGGEVIIPEGVTEIGTGAFQNNAVVTGVTLNEGLKKIGNYAFDKSGLTGTLELPSTVESIGAYAFRGCTSLTGLSLNTGLKTIGNYAFSESNKIAALVLPDTVTSIGNNAFNYCTGLTGSLEIPGSVTSIGSSAFYYCTGLNGTLTLNSGLTTIGSSAFYGCNKLTGDLIIPDSVTSIGSSAFSGCSGFNGRIQLSANLTTISYSTFYDCTNITGELVIPDKVTDIAYSAFSNMTKLASVVFGEKVSRVGTENTSTQPFNNDTGITEVTFKGTTVPLRGSYNSLNIFSPMTNLKTVYVPRESYTAYVTTYSSLLRAGVEISYDTIKMSVHNLQAEKVYSKSVYLSWSPHTNESIVKYVVKRDDIIVGETTDCNYYDNNLTAGQTYTYQVYGLTADDEESGKTSVTATPTEPKINSVKTDNVLNKIGETKNTIYIETPNTKNHLPLGEKKITGLLYYITPGTDERILIGGATVKTITATTVIYTLNWDIEDIEDGTYDVVFVLTDVDDTSAEKMAQITVDHTVPQKIVSVSAIGDISGITLSWAISSEIDTTRYKIYRRSELDTDFYVLTTITSRSTLTYRDTTVAADRLYYYYVVGVNDFGQESPISNVAVALKGVDEELPQVTKLTPAHKSYVNGNVSINVTAIDNVAVTKVEVYYSTDSGETWVLFDTKTSTPFISVIDTTIFDDGAVRVRAIAYDARNNSSSPLAYVYSIDNTGPEKVTGLSYTATSVTVTLSWNDVADDDISFYRVERKNTDETYVKVTDVNKTLGSNILNLTPDTEHVYRVIGYDRLNNRGASSDDIITKTAADISAPVITALSPRPTSNTTSYYPSSVTVSATASDDYAIKSIDIQTSTDRVTWNTVNTAAYADAQAKRTATYTINLISYNEGAIYVRAVATDNAGNVSDETSTAPFVQYIVDRTPPAAPIGVQAIGAGGYIEIKWTKGTEADLGKYSVYRSTQPDSGFTERASSLSTLNYIDRTPNEGQLYYYKVSVKDLAGNESGLSEAVSAQISDDDEVPRVVSVYPPQGDTIGPGYRTVSIYATDNRSLDIIAVKYKKSGTEWYVALPAISAGGSYEKTVSVTIPIDDFSHGDTVELQITATDKAGGVSAPKIVSYVVDKEAPAALNPTASYAPGNDHAAVTWKSDASIDLIGYRIYRKAAIRDFSFIASQSAVADKTDYTFEDYSIALGKETYIYRVDALDYSGNTGSVYTGSITTNDRSAPVAIISCDSMMEATVEYVIDASQSTDNTGVVAYYFDFGDGTASSSRRPVHIYTNEKDEYTITLTVTDEDGLTGTATKTVKVRERAAIGTAEICIVDENGKRVPNAPVYFDLGEENQVVRVTGSDGRVTFDVEAGKHTVGCVIADNNWLPVKKDIIVTAGETTKVTMTLIHHVMIEGVFEIKRMTFDEIIAAGIDPSKPENQYVVTVNVKLTYGTEMVDTSFIYNNSTGRIISRPTIVNTSSGGRAIIPVVLVPKNHDAGIGYEFSKEMTIAFLDIPVGISALKEFFDVKLHIINNASSEFAVKDNRITLNLPDGLTIMDTAVSESNRTVFIPSIGGQTTETITWILRGDKLGEYYLTADYIGVLEQFDEEITARFVANEPIQVLGMQGMKLVVDIANILDHGSLYYNVSLINESDREIFKPNIHTGDILIETELLDAKGALVKGVTGSINTNPPSFPDILKTEERITQHYLSNDQTEYTESTMKLMDAIYEIQNSYGLEVEIEIYDLAYFKKYLDVRNNTKEKADAALSSNQDAYTYVMTHSNFMYWNLYNSDDENMQLTSNFSEGVWDAFKGEWGNLLTGSEDREQSQALLLEIMGIAVEDQELTMFHKTLDFLKSAKGYAEKFKLDKYGEYAFDKTGDMIAHTWDIIYEKYSYEFYSLVIKEQTVAFEDFFYTKMEMTEEYFSFTYESLEVKETSGSEFLHDMFSSDGFKFVWKTIGFTFTAAEMLVSAYENTMYDVSIFINAQSTLDGCNLFLNTIIASNQVDSTIKDAAKRLKENINENDPLDNFFEHMGDEIQELIVKWGVKSAKKILIAISGTPKLLISAVEGSLKLTAAVGDLLFNVSDRHDIADNIRFLAGLSVCIKDEVDAAGRRYLSVDDESTAFEFMQLLQYLIEIRRMGESQLAEFGKSYEGLFSNSRELFEGIRTWSEGILDAEKFSEVRSWNQWRDVVEDHLEYYKIVLLRTPFATNTKEQDDRKWATIPVGENSTEVMLSDSMFADSSYIYNHELGTTASALSAAAYDYIEIHDSLVTLGFDSASIERRNYFLDNLNDTGYPDIVGYTFAHKKIEIAGDEYNLITVAVRGTPETDEWYSNFDIGYGAEPKGFKMAEEKVFNALHEYLAKENLAKNASHNKFLITGHSRGAAVANLLAARLDTGLFCTPDNLFAYTFATPNTTKKYNTYSSDYSNIFNFVNAEDFVPYMPLSTEGWDYWKYGTTLAFPSNGIDSDYESRYKVRLNDKYKSLTGSDFNAYDIFGYASVQRIVNDMSEIAGNVSDYYNTAYPISYSLGIVSLTPQQFFQYLCDIKANALSSVKAIAAMDVLFWLQVETTYGSLARFFVSNTLNGNFGTAHDSLTYLAWMQATDSSLGEHQYRAGRYARIACPVDVEVYSSNGSLVGRVVNDVVDENIESPVAIFVDGDVKHVYMPSYDTYEIKLTGTDDGEMDYFVTDIDVAAASPVDTVQFTKVKLYEGIQMQSEITATETASEVHLFVVDEDDEIIEEILADEPITGVTVTGKVKSYNPGNATTLRLLQENEVMFTTTIEAITESVSGTNPVEQTFTFTDVAPGTYALAVTKPGHTSYTVQNIVVGEETDVDLTQDSRDGAKLITLLCGDINGDGNINGNDLSILWLAANYNKATSAAQTPLCDLNGDGNINGSDLSVLWLPVNYNKGAVIVGP